MRQDEVLRHFEETGALLSGHFKLSSGLHSDRYLQCAKVLQWPARAQELGAALAEKLAPLAPNVIVSPALGGVVIGHEVARALGVRAIFAERADGAFSLRRGFELAEGQRAVVVEDVVTTGKSSGEVLALVRAAGALEVACAAIVDRRSRDRGEPLQGLPVVTLAALDVAVWEGSSCPLCKVGQTMVAPGSRFLAKK